MIRLTAPETKLAKEVAKKIFEESEGRIKLPEVCSKILHEMHNEESKLLVEALDSLNCNISDYYHQMGESKSIGDFLDEELNRMGQESITPRYRRHERSQQVLIRTDYLQEGETNRENWCKLLLNEDSIQKHLLDNEANNKKDSDFEKLCAIYLREHWDCVNVGVLRQSASKDGGLDFFGVRQITDPEPKTRGYFGQAKRQSKVAAASVGHWLNTQYALGFQPMAENTISYEGYVLKEGTEIQKKLREKASSFLESDVYAPMLICAGQIAKIDVKRVIASPHYGVARHGIRFIQEVCIAISKKDKEGFDSWFEVDFPHKFMPDAFDEWLEGQLDSLIIVAK